MSTKTYIGRPCKHGHFGLRYASSRGCVECYHIKAQKKWQKIKIDPELLEEHRADVNASYIPRSTGNNGCQSE
jgi:hypothetical protein